MKSFANIRRLIQRFIKRDIQLCRHKLKTHCTNWLECLPRDNLLDFDLFRRPVHKILLREIKLVNVLEEVANMNSLNPGSLCFNLFLYHLKQLNSFRKRIKESSAYAQIILQLLSSEPTCLTFFSNSGKGFSCRYKLSAIKT